MRDKYPDTISFHGRLDGAIGIYYQITEKIDTKGGTIYWLDALHAGTASGNSYELSNTGSCPRVNGERITEDRRGYDMRQAGCTSFHESSRLEYLAR